MGKEWEKNWEDAGRFVYFSAKKEQTCPKYAGATKPYVNNARNCHRHNCSSCELSKGRRIYGGPRGVAERKKPNVHCFARFQ